MIKNIPSMFKPDQPQKKRNKKENPSLEHIEGILESAPFDAQEARPGLQQGLEQRLLERRANKKSVMKKGFSFNWEMLKRPQAYVPALSVVVIAAVLLLTYYPQGPASIRQQLANMSNMKFKDLIIEPAYAMDNFVVEPTSGDDSGVTKDTAFLIKSKDTVDAQALRQNIKLSPETGFRFEEIDETTFKVTPNSELSNGKVYNLTIDSQFVNEQQVTVERDYSWAFQVRDDFRITHTLPAHQSTGVSTRSGIEITFSAPNVDLESFENSFHIEPAVEGRFEVHNKILVFVPTIPMERGTIYKVTLDDQLTINKQPVALGESVVIEFETAIEDEWEYRSSAVFDQMIYEFGVGYAPLFKLYTSRVKGNDKDIQAKVYAFSSADQFIEALTDIGDKPRWSAYWYKRLSNEKYDTSKLQKVGEYTLPLDFQERNYSAVMQLPDELPKGFYLIETEYNGMESYAYFQVSSLSTYYSVTHNETENAVLAWVNDLSAKAPASGVAISLIGKNGSDITDQNGIATLSFDAQNARNEILKVSRGSEVVVLPFVGAKYAGEWGTYADDQYWNYTYLDKSKYLPTDRLQFWTYMSKRDNVVAPNATELQVELRYGWGSATRDINIVAQQTIRLDSYGSYQGFIDFEELDAGYYYLDVKKDGRTISSQSFQVEQYTKPAYKVDLSVDRDIYFVGDQVDTTISAAFFEGTPVPNMVFRVGNSSNSFYSATPSYSRSKIFAPTDQQGQSTMRLPITTEGCKKEFQFIDSSNNYYSDASCYPFAQEYFVTQNENAELAEISDRIAVPVLRTLVFPEVKVTSPGKGNAALHVETWKVNPDAVSQREFMYGHYNYWRNDELMSGHETGLQIRYRLVERWYEKKKSGTYYDYINKVSRDTYTYTPRVNVHESKDGYIGESGIFQDNSIVIPQNGHRYYIDVIIQDKQGNVYQRPGYVPYEAYGGFDDWYSPWDISDLNLEIDGGRRETPYSNPMFKIGEQVSVYIENQGDRLPELEENGYLFYTMKAGHMDHLVTSRPEYQFIFTDRQIPNVYVQGVHFDGYRYHIASQGFMSSGARVYYDKTERELRVQAEADKAEYKPGDTAKISVSVTDAQGQPRQSTINVNLMDEALFAIAKQDIDVLGQMYRVLPSGEIFHYSSHNVALDAMIGAEGGGCFLPGTKISMADGTKKNIEQIAVGDVIETFANEALSQKVQAKVMDVFVHDGEFNYIVVNENLRVTPVHIIYLNGQWQTAGSLKIGDRMMGEDGAPIVVESLEYKTEKTKVYNFHVETYHTYIADGYYVHNEKGGGDGDVVIRSEFKDIATFKTVHTGRDGTAVIEVDLPDNITQWRVIVQAISDDKYAGQTTAAMNATLPFFVDTVYAQSFLPTDRPNFQFRGYGNALNFESNVDYSFSAPSLGLAKDLSAKAYTKAYVNADAELPVGQHDITITGSSEGYSDGIKKTIEVVRSRLESEKLNTYHNIDENTKLERPDTDEKVEVSFVNERLSAAYEQLYDLLWVFGQRVDQHIARTSAKAMLKEVFGQESWYWGHTDIDWSAYQNADGGIQLLPYDSSRVELTARVANAHVEGLNQAMIISYLESVLNDKGQTREEVLWALYGLSALDQPVLLDVKNFAQLPSHSLLEKELIALSAYNLGDKEYARKMYFDIMGEYGQQSGEIARVVESENEDVSTAVMHTVYAGLLGALVEDDTHYQLWAYMDGISSTEDVYYLEQLRYVKQLLEHAVPTESSLVVSLDEDSETVEVVAGRGVSRIYDPDQLPQLAFSEIRGEITVHVKYVNDDIDIPTSPNLSLRREYRVDGKVTTEFQEDDMVEVRLYADIDGWLRSGVYTVTDLLPSGLIPAQGRLSTWYDYNARYVYPYKTDKQQVKFRTYIDRYSEWKHYDYYVYYARVSTPGTYTAEPAIIQSADNPKHTAISEKQVIRVSAKP
ncbi:hypothetical protein H6758_00050 [Candidatus Nomurabacteria bacterium]|nr:hypothetical protein [Candidatus Nomurabacteria bacterium]